MSEESCLVLIKPDAVQKGLTGNIIATFSELDLKIIGMKVVNVEKELAEKHYNNLKEEQIADKGEELGTKIYEEVVRYIQGEFHTNKVIAIAYKGENAIQKIRDKAGATHPEKAEPSTIRGKYGRVHSGTGVFENVVHASDSAENGDREIALWFKTEELVE